MTSLRANELKSAEDKFRQAAEAELGRAISSDESLSPDDWSSLSNELRRDGATVQTLGSRLERALVDKTEVRVFGGAAYSDEELINKTINDLVDSRVGAIQKIMKQTNDSEFTNLVGAANQVTGALQPLDGASIDTLRSDLLAQTWARYESGEFLITLAERAR